MSCCFTVTLITEEQQKDQSCSPPRQMHERARSCTQVRASCSLFCGANPCNGLFMCVHVECARCNSGSGGFQQGEQLRGLTGVPPPTPPPTHTPLHNITHISLPLARSCESVNIWIRFIIFKNTKWGPTKCQQRLWR